MLVKNKRTNKQMEITPEVWQEMQGKGIANRFKVISDSSPVVEKKEIVIPEEVVNLRKKKKNNTAE